jgi:hypothetical protein
MTSSGYSVGFPHWVSFGVLHSPHNANSHGSLSMRIMLKESIGHLEQLEQQCHCPSESQRNSIEALIVETRFSAKTLQAP